MNGTALRTGSPSRTLFVVLLAATVPVVRARAQEPPAPTGMVWIPGGEFMMGTDDTRSMANERPAHRVRVSGFWMDQHTVTNDEFHAFVAATGYTTTAERKPRWEEIRKQVPPGTPRPDDSMLVAGSLVFSPPPGPVPLNNLAAWWRWTPGADWKHPEGPGSSIDGRGSHPVVHISWDDAAAYAAWAGKSLPTEAQWEFAARGGLESRRYAWGVESTPAGPDGKPRHMANTFQGDFPYRNTADDGYPGTAPVMSYPPNGFGLYDMAGNVWQWCTDQYRADANAIAAGGGLCENPTGPGSTWDLADPHTPVRRVIKGGSYLCHPSYCESYRPSARRGTPPDTGSSHVGFRCIKIAPPPDTPRSRSAGPSPLPESGRSS